MHLIPLVLEEMIPDGSFNNKHLPKHAEIDKILTQINRKYLRRMHLPCSLKDMYFWDTYIAIMFNRYPKHRKAMKKLQQVILSQYMVQGGFLYIYLKNNFGEQEPILCVSPSKIDIFLNQYHTLLLGGHSDSLSVIRHSSREYIILPQLTLLCQIVHNKLPHVSIVQGKQKKV